MGKAKDAPVCYQCGDKPARRLCLPAPHNDKAIFCSLACAAVEAMQLASRIGLLWETGWPGGWGMHEPEGAFTSPRVDRTPLSLPLRLVILPLERRILIPVGWRAEPLPLA